MICPLPAAPWWPPIRAFIRFIALCAMLCALAACALYAKRETSSRAMRAEIPLGAQIGALTLTGAVEWRAARADFGGFSGLELEAENGFVALTDKAHWARAQMVLDAEGILTGIEGLEVGRLNGPDGAILDHPYSDTEALTRQADGAFLIGFENKHRIGRFDTLRASEETLALLPGSDALPPNGSFESVLALPDGRIVAVAETTGDWAAGSPGWIVDGPDITRFAIAKDGWFAPTDLALGPEGAWVYLLERRFTLIGGFAARIRRFPFAALQTGARIEPVTLAEIIGPPLAENYEGLATTRDAAGRIVIYAISDDNFQAIQRTLLLQFRLDEARPPDA